MSEQYEEQYKALGIQHHEKNTEVEPLPHTSVRATLVVVGFFIACFIGTLLALGWITP